MSKNSSLKNVSSNARAAIIDLLVLCNDGAYANEIVPQRLNRSDFSIQDKALITNAVYTALRNQIKIDYALSGYSKRPIEKLDAIVINSLRSVVAQLMIGLDAHGVVNETINVMPFAYKSFVNAISRKITSEIENKKFFTNEPLNIKYSLPIWIVEEMEKVFGQDCEKYLAYFNEAPSVTLFDIKPDLYETQVRYTDGEIVPTSRVLESSGDIRELDSIKNGTSIVVDQGSQLIVNSIPIMQSDNILDLCCAPGGKSFMMATRAASVIANDVVYSRMKKLLDTKKRTKIDNVFPIVCDATQNSFLNESFDVVLVDAPCSGLGVLRRRPDARNNIEETIVEELFELQKNILIEAIGLVKPGGLLVYSVCTFSDKETVGIDSWLEEKYSDLSALKVDNMPDAVIKKSRGYLLAPGTNNDSMYFLILRKPH